MSEEPKTAAPTSNPAGEPPPSAATVAKAEPRPRGRPPKAAAPPVKAPAPPARKPSPAAVPAEEPDPSDDGPGFLDQVAKDLEEEWKS